MVPIAATRTVLFERVWLVFNYKSALVTDRNAAIGTNVNDYEKPIQLKENLTVLGLLPDFSALSLFLPFVALSCAINPCL